MAQSLILRTLEEPKRLLETWSRLCELAYAAGIEVLHPQRGLLGESVAIKEAMVRRGIDLASRMEQFLGHPLENADRLPAAAEQLRQFKMTVLDRWQTPDDLAEMLIERFPLSSEQLQRMAALYPPPQSWYDEEFDPFTPEERVALASASSVS